MDLSTSLQLAEQALLNSLESKRSGIDDRTGKGSATERVICDLLLEPQFPAGIKATKGSIVAADEPNLSSPAIDRIVHDPSLAPPLVHSDDHSVLPIEAVVGLVEITMRLDASKLREDIVRMSSVKAMRKRRYLIPVPGTATQSYPAKVDALSPRSFVVGVPEDRSWKPETIAASLRSIQIELGPPTHVHGLYVIGIGFFETIPIENPTDPAYRISGWTGSDRMFRFTNAFRRSIDRWPRIPLGWAVHLDDYVGGTSAILAE
jgi:hypothetical protein